MLGPPKLLFWEMPGRSTHAGSTSAWSVEQEGSSLGPGGALLPSEGLEAAESVRLR